LPAHSRRHLDRSGYRVCQGFCSGQSGDSGSSIHIGDEKVLGIPDLSRPDFGDSVTIKDGETPVYWACGVTSTLAVLPAKPSLCITHAPGYMVVTDVLNEQLALISPKTVFIKILPGPCCRLSKSPVYGMYVFPVALCPQFRMIRIN
jgi:hypothetical protein